MSNQGPQLRHKASEPATGKGASIAEEREKQAALKAYANDEGHFSLVRNFRMADIITLGNAVCGTLCIFLCIRYLSLSANMSGAPSEEAMTSLYWAHFLPMLGFGFDALDGRVARMMGGGSLLGQELDSLADLISFGVAPATLAYTLGMRLPLDIACLLFFVSGGLARLARFNATVALVPTGKSGSIKFFTGIPIPSSLGLTAFMWGCAKTGHFVGAKGWTGSVGDVAGKLAAGKQVAEIDWAAIRRLGDLPGGTIKLFGEAGGIGEVHLLSFVFLAWAAAMVSKTLKVPKL
ncbi:putative CDP-diacylglycerol-serine O-phosphatidyltransferase [Filobasidium floriforme]|uniref:putative CDP-diacylglycerol-serine O-phosphatidyltransferase n=1 Tax=Filobasidium floriforme TaxID=5210 RepID=UPI001E8D1831|nr:putative CDP-diacylglycerol-serine O-phosphatidyltransferase [Filobasidium floriforme]KAH8081276.1 putative CDP-diacylglycerol-serine O-phosphatidyltransferase [Filobasidium floriforme]